MGGYSCASGANHQCVRTKLVKWPCATGCIANFSEGQVCGCDSGEKVCGTGKKALFEEGLVRPEAPMIGQAFLLLFLLEKSNKTLLEEETSL